MDNQKYIEVGAGPDKLPKYHTVIDLPSKKGRRMRMATANENASYHQTSTMFNGATEYQHLFFISIALVGCIFIVSFGLGHLVLLLVNPAPSTTIMAPTSTMNQTTTPNITQTTTKPSGKVFDEDLK